VILGGRTYTLWGACTLTDTLCGLRFRVSPAAFFQVNRVQAEMLYKIAGEYARAAGKVVWDLYCGTGTIGLTLAREAKAVVGVENAPAAVADAQENARENGINNARFFCADAAVISVGTQDSVAVWAAATETDAMGGDLRRALREFPPDVVILDPPRKGCDAAVLDTVAALAPERVVYVSCDPGTLARDLKRLGEKGYICTAVTPVDMFPRTAHVECVALAEKKG
ncbi:MAG: methyltransferase domain-containing protein, partial [Oscillospiraceae bacterium]|nr:methyltransferase domain-containing protein [Oscillospiraceae bacterium]